MSTNAFALTPAEETQIHTAADAMIRTAAQRANMTFEDVPQYAKEDAFRTAKAAFEEQKAQESNPLWKELQAEREAHALTQKTLAATQQVRPQPVNGSRDTGPDPLVVRAQMGEGNWRALTDDGRLQACGVNPTTVTQADLTEAKRVFGRGTDTHFASNLAKADFARYKHLKRIAVVLNIQGQ